MVYVFAPVQGNLQSDIAATRRAVVFWQRLLTLFEPVYFQEKMQV